MAAACLRLRSRRSRFRGQGRNRTFEGTEVAVELVRNKLGLPPGSARLFLAAPDEPEEAWS